MLRVFSIAFDKSCYEIKMELGESIFTLNSFKTYEEAFNALYNNYCSD